MEFDTNVNYLEDAFWQIIISAGPVLLVALAIGLFVGIIQAATSINEIIPGLDLQNIIEILLAFFLTSIRLSAFIVASPLFSARFIMLRVRILMAFVISIIVFSIHPLEIDTKIPVSYTHLTLPTTPYV